MVILLEIESKLNFLFNDNNLMHVGATYAILATPTQFGPRACEASLVGGSNWFQLENLIYSVKKCACSFKRGLRSVLACAKCHFQDSRNYDVIMTSW